ncbi:hypothetical protein L9F63_018113, partial [Diploptera punctata]
EIKVCGNVTPREFLSLLMETDSSMEPNSDLLCMKLPGIFQIVIKFKFTKQILVHRCDLEI